MPRSLLVLLLAACFATTAGLAGCLGSDERPKGAGAGAGDTGDTDDPEAPGAPGADVPDPGDLPIPVEPPASAPAPAAVFIWVNHTDEVPATPVTEPGEPIAAASVDDRSCGLLGTGLQVRLLGIRLGDC